LWEADWSRDGRYVVAVTADWERLMIYDFSNQKWTTLVQKQNIMNPTWSRDGSYVYFDTIDVEDSGIYRVGRANGKLERLASLRGFRKTSLTSATMNLAPDGSPVLLRNTSIEEIYALGLADR
jgi:hypothetical protein